MKIAITADLHLNNSTYNIKDKDTGLPIKTVDSFKAFDFFVDECISRKVDRVVLAGDIYDNHHPGSTIMEMFNRRIQKVSAEGIQAVIMTGNHDMSGDSHAISPARGWLPNIKIVDKPIVENSAAGFVAIYVPHTRDIESGEMSFPQAVASMRPDIPDGVPCIFFGHFSVNGAMRNDSSEHSKKTDVSAGDIMATGATHAFLGHFHKHQKIGDGIPMYYVGSLERHRMDEIDGDRGFYIFDTSTLEMERVEYKGQRPMKKIYAESFEEAYDDITHEESWEGNIVRIEFEGDEKEYVRIKSNFKELRSEFERRGGAVLKLADVKYAKQDDEEEERKVSMEDLDLMNMISDRVDKDFSGDEEERKAVMVLANSIYKEALEK
jgi:DNA repair exonuclease SbcCD nuclease subunit